jgi:Mg2+-importing ATPase
MNLGWLKELFAGFLRTRHIARHFRLLALLDTQSAGTKLL